MSRRRGLARFCAVLVLTTLTAPPVAATPQPTIAPASTGAVPNTVPAAVSPKYGLTRAELRDVISSWDRGTFDSQAKTIRYHWEQHGMGRSIAEYTDDAREFLRRHRPDMTVRAPTKPGYQRSLSFRDRMTGAGGAYTLDGRILTYWDRGR
jgi:hypothetical protein